MSAKSRGLSNSVRIIGGKWRGKKISFADISTLRPTPDRVRETVFNWLQFHLSNAKVLDLFAGSGIFGLESLSRGAAISVFVDANAKAVSHIKASLADMQIDYASVVQNDVLRFLEQNSSNQRFDIVFLDPPYGENLLQPSMELLEKNHWLADQAYIYLEAESRNKQIPLPPQWQLHRSKISGQVGYHLAIRRQSQLEGTQQ
ncbi:16S rRNA (guanine(966)-N(2))-methyltransferase RsmD [Kaarinaea lacus]